VGQQYFIKKSQTECGRVEPDGTFTPVDHLYAIQYTVVAEEKDVVQVVNQTKRVWVRKDDLVKLREAPEYFTKQLDADPNNDRWFAFRAWPSTATAGRRRP